MQKVIPFPLLANSRGKVNHRLSLRVIEGAVTRALTFGLHALRAVVTAPPEQERIEEFRARYSRVTGHF